MELLTLDPRIRDWVLLPIFIVMFLQGLLRHYLAVATSDPTPPTLSQVVHTQVLKRSARLRENGTFISPESFSLRRHNLLTSPLALGGTAEERKKRHERLNENSPPGDPLAMMGMMKQTMFSMLPQLLQFAWVSYFFSGFVAAKLPFPLTERLKSMIQRGVPLKALDSAYVSSTSWYVLMLMGFSGVYQVVLGSTDNVQSQEQLMLAGAMGGTSPFGTPTVDYEKVYQAERDELHMTKHENYLAESEMSLLR